MAIMCVRESSEWSVMSLKWSELTGPENSRKPPSQGGPVGGAVTLKGQIAGGDSSYPTTGVTSRAACELRAGREGSWRSGGPKGPGRGSKGGRGKHGCRCGWKGDGAGFLARINPFVHCHVKAPSPSPPGTQLQAPELGLPAPRQW